MACRFFVCSPSFLATLTSSKWLFFLFGSFSVAILCFQPDPPTLKTLDLNKEKQHFAEICVWDLKMVLRMVWASLGHLFGTLGGFLRGLFFLLKILSSTLEPPQCPPGAPKRSPGGPDSPTRRPHDEADGPTRPPRLIWRRVGAYFPEIWITKSKKKRKQETSSRPFRGDFGAVQFRAFLLFLLCFSCSAFSSSSCSSSSSSASPSSTLPSPSPSLSL